MKLILILISFSIIFVNGAEQHDESEISGMYTMKRIEGDIRGFYEGLLRMIEKKAGTADFTDGMN